jgi:hypothetical protein
MRDYNERHAFCGNLHDRSTPNRVYPDVGLKSTLERGVFAEVGSIPVVLISRNIL